jgi:hypothetical protein
MRVETQVRSIDLLPTLLDLVDVPVPDTVEGVSLSSFCGVTGEATDSGATEYAYMENVPSGWIGLRTPDWKLILTDAASRRSQAPSSSTQGAGTLGVLRAAVRDSVNTLVASRDQIHPLVYGVLRQVYRMARQGRRLLSRDKSADPGAQVSSLNRLRSPSVPEVRDYDHVFALHDLHEDPREREDVAAEHPEVVRRLKGKIMSMSEDNLVLSGSVSAADLDDIEQRLRALGYL